MLGEIMGCSSAGSLASEVIEMLAWIGEENPQRRFMQLFLDHVIPLHGKYSPR